MIRCQRCSSDNDDEARYCDQCGAALAGAAPGKFLPDPCPACGGKLAEVPSTAAACRECGLRLADGAALPAEGSAHAEEPAPSDREVAPSPADGPKLPCPVCALENPQDAARCGDCGIVFKKRPGLLVCPRCSAECSDDKCGCGAILTLARLVEYVDESVQSVCPVCKSLFSVRRDACSDCGSELEPAADLKAYADGVRGH
ncbi:MAG: hypothetical protein A2X36_03050 [Elusimicrobia bacterium GWA2_69_24]|nr:MAG: hypothetical protein A2X36_03050 [Elusimicrobia bacterium GWA2_69_24]HBL19234.1 hypothetical protein [Elusimicrobiota bacterium]